MLKKSIKYTDFNGDQVTEDFYFNLSKAELVELELSHEGGLKNSLEKIVADEDGAGIVRELKNIILKSYGKKSADGRRFIKNQELRDDFESTEAYSELFMSLATDAGAAAEFVQGIVPTDLTDEDVAKIANQSAEISEAESKKRVVTPAEVANMEPPEFARLKEEINAGKAMIKDPSDPLQVE